jgi:hypothetical protein
MHDKALGDDLRHNFRRLRPGVLRSEVSAKARLATRSRAKPLFASCTLSQHMCLVGAQSFLYFTLGKSRSEPIGIAFKAPEGSSKRRNAMAQHTYQDDRAMKPEPKYFAPPEVSEMRTIHVLERPETPATVVAKRRGADGDWFHRAQLESMGIGPRVSR